MKSKHKDRQLLFSVTKKDFTITWFSGSGAGGQHRNKHQNCCRITHSESGASATGQEQRSREQNLRTAFLRLARSKTFQAWLRTKASNVMLDMSTIEKEVDDAMCSENLLIEYGVR